MGSSANDPGGLAIVHTGRVDAPPGPVAGTAAGDRLHLFGTGRGEAGGWHLALDPDGDPVAGPARTGLPAVRSLAPAADTVLVTCANGPGAPVLARVARDGSVTCRTGLPLDEPLGQWPRVAATSSTSWYAWTTRQDGGELWWLARRPALAGLERRSGHEARPVWGTRGSVRDLAVAAQGATVLVAGLVGDAGQPARIVVRVSEGGRLTGVAEVPDVANPAFLRVYAGARAWWVLWKERIGGALLARRLRYGRAPNDPRAWDPPMSLYRTRPPHRVHDAHLIMGGPAGGVTAVALLVRVAAAGGHRYRDLVAQLLPRDGTAAGFRELTEPGTGWSAGGWLDGRLVLVHGRSRPHVTVLAPTTTR